MLIYPTVILVFLQVCVIGGVGGVFCSTAFSDIATLLVFEALTLNE